MHTGIRAFLFIAIGMFFFVSLPAYALTGNIEPSFSTTKVCHDTTCASPTPGILNFRPTGTTEVVVDTVTGLSGYIWGNELGWIKLNPTGEGVTFADPDTGLLTGKAWSQVSGWINFAPTGQAVTVSPTTGQFSGWAWTGGPYGGWITFDCSDNTTCIKTDWNNGASGDDGGGGTSSSIPQFPDVCPNLSGVQPSIPPGYTVNISGACVSVVDACPNLLGDQSSMPAGFVYNSIGACIPQTVDYCPNLSGTQTAIPSGYTLTHAGCVRLAGDVCPDTVGVQSSYAECKGKDSCKNILGIQKDIPFGYIESEGACYPATLDMCTNIEGTQAEVPRGMIVAVNGECIAEPTDVCANLAGYQSAIPNGFYAQGSLCLFGNPDEQGSGTGDIVAFRFIPSWLRMPSDNAILQIIVQKLGIRKDTGFTVDTMSALVVAAGGLFILYLLIRLLRLFFAR